VKNIILFFFLIAQLCADASNQQTAGAGKLIYVAKDGKDNATGTVSKPLLTISKAFSLAQPGDEIIVRRGTYREMVTLDKGGVSGLQRIKIRAASGEVVRVKGSERVKGWIKDKKGIWQLTTDTIFFKGSLYFNDAKMKRDEWDGDLNLLCYRSKLDRGKVLISANFGKDNPNRALVEMPVRPSGIRSLENVNYITIEHIQISQVSGPAGNISGKQTGAVETGGGTHWIIQNCVIRDCSGIGISVGNTGRDYPQASPRNPEFSNYDDIADIGHHIITNNHIFNCGQAGIFGLAGGTATLIEGNLIEAINTEGLYTGGESAGIRLALAVDAVIKGNLIRKVKGRLGRGIYLGPLFQAARISENIISDTQAGAVYLFNSHGPALIDNNVFAPGDGQQKPGVKMLATEANVFINNLFYDCSFTNERLPGKSVATSNYLPHTLSIKQTIPSLNIDHRWLGNIFLKQKLKIPACTGCIIKYNIFRAGTGFGLLQKATAAKVMFDSVKNRPVPRKFTPESIGFFALSKQYLDYPGGNPRLPSSFSLSTK
jgi:hypothetical protein